MAVKTWVWVGLGVVGLFIAGVLAVFGTWSGTALVSFSITLGRVTTACSCGPSEDEQDDERAG